MNLSDLLARVRPEVLHCPPDLMVQQLRDTIRDFCNVTRAWKYEVEFETVMLGISEYDIELPSTDAEPIAIEYMTVDEAVVTFKTTAWLDANIANWRYRETDDFRFFTQLQPKLFNFPCVPTVNGTAGGMYYRVALRPTEDATTIDDTLAGEWIECWADGAKSRLMLMEGKDWYKPKRGAELEVKYRAARGLARIQVARSYGNTEERWANPRGFA